MDSMKTPFLSTLPLAPSPHPKPQNPRPTLITLCTITPDPWTLSDGNNSSYKKQRKKPLSDDNARRIIKRKAHYLSVLRRNQGSHVQTPKWIQRSPQQMVKYLEDDRDGHLYGKHVVAAIRIVRNLASKADGDYDMRQVMGSFVTKLTFSEMCIVLKEQKGWRQVRDFFAWIKLQLQYRPSVIVYTIVLRIYGQVGKIKLAEQTFLEMLEAGCEPDEVACGTMLCAYARWGRHRAMLSFYSAVQERKIIPSVAVFNFMISSLQKKSLHEKAIHLWDEMLDAGVEPTHFTYTIVICSYAKEGLVEQAFETFSKMKSSGHVPEEVTYSLLISLSAKRGNRGESLNLYEDMRFQGIVPSNYTCATLLTLYYKNRDYPKALVLLSEMEKNKIIADEVIYGIIIRIYGKLGMYSDAQKTFEDIEKLGLLTDEKTYIAMAQVHLSARSIEQALSVLDLMRSRNILFSRFAYVVQLKCHCIKEDLASAEVTFEALSKTGIPDAASCKDLLNLYVRVGYLDKAKAFIIKMKKDLVHFDEELYTSVVKLYCTEGMVEDIEQLTEEMGTSGIFKSSNVLQTFCMAKYGASKITKGVEKLSNASDGSAARLLVKVDDSLDPPDQPNTMALEMLLKLYIGGGDVEKTLHVLKVLLQTLGGLSVASQLIRAFVREGAASKAQSVHDQVLKLGYRPEDEAIASLISLYVFASVLASLVSVKPVYWSMIDACLKCGNPDEALTLYLEMVQKHITTDAVTISILVNAMTSYGKHQEAYNIIQLSFQEKHELDTVAYNTFIKAMLEAGKLYFASQIYERMLSSGVSPSIQTYNTMISVYGRGRKLDKAVEMLNVARSLNVILDDKTYTNMINYYGKFGKTREASDLFNKMQEEGIKPGKVAYNIMMNVYATEGLELKAERMYHEMQRQGCFPDSFTYQALLRAYTATKNFSKAEETVREMQNIGGISPSSAHISSLISGFAKEGLIRDAERIYGKYVKNSLGREVACHGTMLRGYVEYGHVEEAILLFERISGEGVELDRFVFSAGVHLYRFIGDEVKASCVLDSMKKLGVPFLSTLEIGSRMK
ncbi:hypothetical protein ACHQM5_007922 [Ranunculus cassubicifolius]